MARYIHKTSGLEVTAPDTTTLPAHAFARKGQSPSSRPAAGPAASTRAELASIAKNLGIAVGSKDTKAQIAAAIDAAREVGEER